MAVAQQLKSLGRAISFRSGLSCALAQRQQCARIVMYHGTVSDGAAALHDQLSYLTRNFSIVPLPRLVDGLARKDTSASSLLALTFDDGLRNNFTVAYPILRDLRLPATFFVCPALIESGRWLWNHEARCRLQVMDRAGWSSLRRYLPAFCRSAEHVILWMKSLGLRQRCHAEEHIRTATPRYVPSASQREAYDVMSWKDLLSLDPALITIGSHSLSHPILTTLEEHELIQEVQVSRWRLEKRLNRPVDLFCYPNGSHDVRVLDAVKKFYDAAVTTESGMMARTRNFDRYRLPRIPGADTAALMAWRLHRPGA